MVRYTLLVLSIHDLNFWKERGVPLHHCTHVAVRKQFSDVILYLHP